MKKVVVKVSNDRGMSQKVKLIMKTVIYLLKIVIEYMSLYGCEQVDTN